MRFFRDKSISEREPERSRTHPHIVHLMGRVTYEEMVSHWPSSDSDYAAPMNEIPKVVFSKTLAEANWPDSQIARGDLAEEIVRLKGEPGLDMIAWGGARSRKRSPATDSSTSTGPSSIRWPSEGACRSSTIWPRRSTSISWRRFPTGRVVHLYREA